MSDRKTELGPELIQKGGAAPPDPPAPQSNTTPVFGFRTCIPKP